MTTKVRQCEDNIKKLNKISFNSNIESGIKDNIQINLVDKLRTFTMNFRKNEETYMRNYKELVGDKLDDDDNILDISHSHKNSNFLQLDEDTNILAKRDEEINTLLNSINDLASIDRKSVV